jgi:hypothetical protein
VCCNAEEEEDKYDVVTTFFKFLIRVIGFFLPHVTHLFNKLEEMEDRKMEVI